MTVSQPRSSQHWLKDRPTAQIAWGGDKNIEGTQFLADIAALMTLLPARSHIVNLCRDRYHFTVAFMAAMKRGQVTLLPSSEAPAAITDVLRHYPDAYVLHELDMAPPDGVPAIAYPTELDQAASVDGIEFPDEQQAVILFTSGSTGDPVPHPRSWGVLAASTRGAAGAFGIGDYSGGCIFSTVPHQHSYGLESIVMLALQHGFAIHRRRPLLPADIVAALGVLPEPRIFVTTPIHLRGLLAEEGRLPSVSRIISATAPLHPGLAAAAEERFGAPLYEIYGCSEIGQIAARRTVETAEWQCLDGIELAETDGEVWARGPAAASEAPLNDVIDLRTPSRFFLLGRKSDMINIAGKRSSLSFLNLQLASIPGGDRWRVCRAGGCRQQPANARLCGRPCSHPAGGPGGIAPGDRPRISSPPLVFRRCVAAEHVGQADASCDGKAYP